MAEELPPDDLPAPDPMPRIAAELAVAQALGAIGLNWAHFQEDHEDEAAVLLDAATLAEVHYSDELRMAAEAVVDEYNSPDPDEEKGNTELWPLIDDLEAALYPDSGGSDGAPSDDDLAAMADAVPVGKEGES